MPGIPLLNFGTALGGLAGGWNQARSQGLQQAIQQLALQQAQGQTNQQTLANLALKAGLLNQGGGQTPLQAAVGAVPNQTAPAPTQTASSGGGPQVSPSSGMPMPPGYTYTPPAPMSPYGPPGDNSIDSASEVQLNADAGQDQFGATNQAIAASGATPPSAQTASSGGSDATPAQNSMPTITATPGQVAPGGIQAGGSDSGSGSGSGGIGMQFGNGPPIDMSTMFQRLDYQKLAQGIEALAPPGTSQADIYGAVVDLAKLADGDKTQQQQAAYMLKLLGIQGRMVEINQQQTGATARTAMQQKGADQRAQLGADTRTTLANQADATKRYVADQTAQIRRDALSANTTAKWTQIAQKQQEIANRLAAQGQTEAARLMSLQLSALRARISTIATTATGSGGTLTEDQTRELQDLNNRAAAIATQATGQGAGP